VESWGKVIGGGILTSLSPAFAAVGVSLAESGYRSNSETRDIIQSALDAYES